MPRCLKSQRCLFSAVDVRVACRGRRPSRLFFAEEYIPHAVAKDVLFVDATGLQVILKFTKNLLRLSLRLTIQSQILYWGI